MTYSVVWSGLFFCAFFLSLLLTPVCRAVAVRVGLMDRPGARKIHDAAVPYGGGVAVWLSFGLTLTAALFAFFFMAGRPADGAVAHDAAAHLAGAKAKLGLLLHLCGGGLGFFLLGLIDDKAQLKAGAKLLFQAALAVCVVAAGVRADFFSANPLVGGALSAAWIVLIANSFNLLDNMNGLCAGVASIAGVFYFAIALLTGQWFIAALLATFTGAVAGFLPYNYPRASVFLGDAGSYFIGYMLAAMTILSNYYFESSDYPVYVVLFPALVLAVPLFDTATVVLIRLKLRTPVFQGDNNHFSHRLTALGMSRSAAVATIYLLTVVTGLSSVLLYFTSGWGGALLLAQIVLILLLVHVVERGSRAGKN